MSKPTMYFMHYKHTNRQCYCWCHY